MLVRLAHTHARIGDEKTMMICLGLEHVRMESEEKKERKKKVNSKRKQIFGLKHMSMLNAFRIRSLLDALPHSSHTQTVIRSVYPLASVLSQFKNLP